MSLFTFSQASLATAVGLSAAGICVGFRQPNPSPRKIPATGDSIRSFVDLYHQHDYIVNVLIGGLALQHISLILTCPNTPPAILRHATTNGLQSCYITWSKETAIPIALILGVGAPLRVVSYETLGKNFTFGLSTPDRLNTGGLYRYVQHPSYTGLIALFLGIVGLWGPVAGTLSCFIPPWLFPTLRHLELVTISIPPVILAIAVFFRVRDEERLLHSRFGSEWEAWHARTARFIPYVF